MQEILTREKAHRSHETGPKIRPRDLVVVLTGGSAALELLASDSGKAVLLCRPCSWVSSSMAISWKVAKELVK